MGAPIYFLFGTLVYSCSVIKFYFYSEYVLLDYRFRCRCYTNGTVNISYVTRKSKINNTEAPFVDLILYFLWQNYTFVSLEENEVFGCKGNEGWLCRYTAVRSRNLNKIQIKLCPKIFCSHLTEFYVHVFCIRAHKFMLTIMNLY